MCEPTYIYDLWLDVPLEPTIQDLDGWLFWGVRAESPEDLMGFLEIEHPGADWIIMTDPLPDEPF